MSPVYIIHLADGNIKTLPRPISMSSSTGADRGKAEEGGVSHPVSSPDPTHHAENTGKLLYYNKPRCGARCAVLCGADEMNEVHQNQLACLLLLPVLSSVLLLVIIIFIYPGAFF